MQVSLDVFSGRPNPTWELSPGQTSELVDRLGGRRMPALHAVQPRLGYRGHIVKASPTDDPARTGLPYTFRVQTSGDDDLREHERWLMSTAKGAVEDDVADYVVRELDPRRTTAPRSLQLAAKKHDARDPADNDCVIFDSPFIPWFWNQLSVMPYNNCYNYATNYRSNTFALPGRASGHLFAALSCDEVRAAAVKDGYHRNCTGIVNAVALVIWPGFDFHWYRNHPEGFWGHKIGPTPATNLDNMNTVITDEITPAACARGPYTDFCGFVFPPVWLTVL